MDIITETHNRLQRPVCYGLLEKAIKTVLFVFFAVYEENAPINDQEFM